MNHEQGVVFELYRHHLQRCPLLVIAEEDESRAGVLWSISGWTLLEAQATLLDDAAGAFTAISGAWLRREPISGSRAQSSGFVGQY